MKKIFIFLFFFFVTLVAFSQQEVQISHNMFNHMDVNPGYAGMNDAICATLIAHQQWVGFKDPDGNKVAPQTYLLSLDGAVNPLHGGLGMTIMQDQLGFEKNLGIKLSYAYKTVAGPGNIGIGAQIGFLNKKIDFTKFKYIDVNDPLLVSGGKDEGNMATDFAFGTFYNIPNKLYCGISASQLSQAEIPYNGTLAKPTLARHYYVEAGYYYPIPGNPSLEIDPSILIKSDFASTQFDVNALLKYNNQFWGGLSYRTVDAIVVLLGMNWKSFHFGYSYDITTSALGAKGRSSGSHEIMIGYCFKIIREFKPESYKNPRFL
ncbi:MAG: type IX secretion system membrane protein PorP/SprF [Bacteroidales bacterium]